MSVVLTPHQNKQTNNQTNKKQTCLFAAADRDHYKKSVKMQTTIHCGMPNPNGYIYNMTPAPKAQETSQKKRTERL